jgi:hypothetical protein
MFSFCALSAVALDQNLVNPNKICEMVQLKATAKLAETKIDPAGNVYYQYSFLIEKREMNGKVKEWSAVI